MIIYCLIFIILAVGFSDGYKMFDEKLECGVIIKKLTPSVESVSKSTSTLEIKREFVMKYDNGVVKDITVCSSTFYSYNEGERCCFTNHYMQNNVFIACCLAISYILIFIYIAITIIFLFHKFVYNSKDKLSEWFLFDFKD